MAVGGKGGNQYDPYSRTRLHGAAVGRPKVASLRANWLAAG